MHEDDHGHSPAAWTGVAVMLVAAALACYAVVFGPVWLFWAGGGLFLAGGLLWYALGKAGYGSPAEVEAEEPSTSTR